MSSRAGVARPDRRGDRRQRRHRPRDGAARPRRGRRRDPHRAQPRAPGARRRASSARSSAAFDATDFDRLGRFFDELPDADRPRAGDGPRSLLRAARGVRLRRGPPRRRGPSPAAAAGRPARGGQGPPGGTLLFMGGTGGRRPGVGMSLISALTAAGPALTRNLALELAPVRVNLIAAGFVDTPLSASLLGDQLEARREELRDELPIAARRRPRRHRRAGRPPHEQHGAHRRDVRHRRRPAARLRPNT